jgi:hypothetical protein
MKKVDMKNALLLALLIMAASPVVHGQALVYDNTTTYLNNNMPLLPEWRDDSAEVGDEIWLAGTEREIVAIRMFFVYRGTIPGTIDLKVRFRSIIDEMPGDIIYESDMYVGVPTVSGINEYLFDVPGVMVPDRFVWTVQAYNRQGSVGEIGPAYYHPATIGWSDDFFWQSDMGSPWTPYSWGGDPYASFGASLYAVPEPASALVLALGIAAARRRRRRASQS